MTAPTGTYQLLRLVQSHTKDFTNILLDFISTFQIPVCLLIIYLTSVCLLFLLYCMEKYLCHQIVHGRNEIICVWVSELQDLPTVTQLINGKAMAWIHVQTMPNPCLWPLTYMLSVFPDKVSSGLNYSGRQGRCSFSHLPWPANTQVVFLRALEASTE